MGMTWNGPDVDAQRHNAVRLAGEALLEEARARAPRETGELAASGFAEADGDTVRVGFAAPYAVRQHFRDDYQHDDGEAMYLANAAEAFGPQFEAIAAEEIRRSLGR